MSRRTLPLLYLNLGGEMMYIIEERLHAQSVDPNKSAKVTTDLISLILNTKILEEILQPQDLHSRDALEVIFENIANATSMRIDSDSMHRMYSIMIMSVKYQLLRAGSPQDMLGLTLNHMDGMREMLTGTSRAHLLLDKAYEIVVTAYSKTSLMEMHMIRATLLGFFQDARERVRKYVDAGQQISRNGKFIIPLDMALSYGVKAPVQIRHLGEGGKTVKLTMVHEERANYTEQTGVISWAPKPRANETRGTHLGTNFHKFGDLDPMAQEDRPLHEDRDRSPEDPAPRGNITRPMSRQELSLLRTVIDSRGGQPNATFRLNLYNRTQATPGPPKGPLIGSKGLNGRKPQVKGPGGRVVLPKIAKKGPDPGENGVANGQAPRPAKSLNSTPRSNRKTMDRQNSMNK